MKIVWKYAYASVPGRYHLKIGLPCQDFCDCRCITVPGGETVLIAVAADGAGSARFAEMGAKLACYLLADGIKELLESGINIDGLTRDKANSLIEKLQQEVAFHAHIYGSSSRDFASTLIAAVIGLRESVFFQIGDGAAVISQHERPGEYRPVFWPQNKEYVNMTHFVTDCGPGCEAMEYVLLRGAVDELAIFSDGLQSLALQYQSRTAYTPFFKPLFASLASLDSGNGRVLNSLSSFLNSDKFNKRTDDDKTLVIAVRVSRGI
jgi:hypothetical protein